MQETEMVGKVVKLRCDLQAIKVDRLESGTLVMYHDKAMSSLIQRALEG